MGTCSHLVLDSFSLRELYEIVRERETVFLVRSQLRLFFCLLVVFNLEIRS